jgi:hypothetical protein
MSVVGYRVRNHPQQVRARGARADVDDRATHPDFFATLDVIYGFTLDVAASPENAKCERYFTAEQDGLRQSWAGEVVWCNPPYSSIAPWVAKAWREVTITHTWEEVPRGSRWTSGRAFRYCLDCDREEWLDGSLLRPGEHNHKVPTILMLLPANRTEQKWWQQLVEPRRDQPGSPLRVQFLPGRLRFLSRGQSAIGPNERPPFGCCLLIWSPA